MQNIRERLSSLRERIQQAKFKLENLRERRDFLKEECQKRFGIPITELPSLLVEKETRREQLELQIEQRLQELETATTSR